MNTRATRLLSVVLALVLLLGLLPPPLASAAGTSTYNGKSYSTDYTTWRQGNSAWGPTALGDVHTMTQSGCLISSIAILMCSSGAYNPASLNSRQPAGLAGRPGLHQPQQRPVEGRPAVLWPHLLQGFSPVLFCEPDVFQRDHSPV
ncbi:MAG: hypothetical protein ACLUNZ_03445 [Evtepia sp.]